MRLMKGLAADVGSLSPLARLYRSCGLRSHSKRGKDIVCSLLSQQNSIYATLRVGKCRK